MLIRKCINCGTIVGIKLTKPFWKFRLWGITGTACNECMKEKIMQIHSHKLTATCHC